MDIVWIALIFFIGGPVISVGAFDDRQGCEAGIERGLLAAKESGKTLGATCVPVKAIIVSKGA